MDGAQNKVKDQHVLVSIWKNYDKIRKNFERFAVEFNLDNNRQNCTISFCNSQYQQKKYSKQHALQNCRSITESICQEKPLLKLSPRWTVSLLISID